jgi:hypothetical protein
MLNPGDTQINAKNLEVQLNKPRNLTKTVIIQDCVCGVCLSNLCSDTEYLEGLFYGFTQHLRGTQWRSWLRHFAKSRMVSHSNFDGVTEIFH